MKKILVLGSTGMLGFQVIKTFSKISNFELTATYRQLNKKKILNQKFKNVNFIKYDNNILKKDFDIIINCIGIIKPMIKNSSVESIKNAININSLLPLEIAKNLHNKTTVYQIATDCVYSGEGGKYFETSPHDAKDVYGKTKSLGEIKSKNYYHLRCSIIGPEFFYSRSLLSWFLNNKKKSKIKGYSNHFWNGLTTKAFAEFLLSIIQNNIQIPNLLHICPKDYVTKYELIKFFIKYSKRNDIKVLKFIDKNKINRILKTNYKKINRLIWNKSIYKRVPKIEELIEDMFSSIQQ